MKRVVVLVALVAFVAACDDQSQTFTTPAQPQALIWDGAHSQGGLSGNPEFYFLPPLVKQPTLPDNFDPMAWPTVEICAIENTTADAACGGAEDHRFTRGDLIDESTTHFHVDWDTSGDELGVYRIYVLFGSSDEDVLEVLGYRDVEIGGNGKANAPIKGITPGSTERIKFYIGENAGCWDAENGVFNGDCVLATVTNDGNQLLTGNKEAIFIADAGSLPGGETVAVKLELVSGDCIGFDDAGGNLIPIDLAQYPDCYKLTTFPSDAPFTSLQTFGICLEHDNRMINETAQVFNSRLHRMSDDRDTVQVMDLVDVSALPCVEVGSLDRNPFMNFARGALRRLGLPIAPPPLRASALVVRHEGLGGRGDGSTLGFAMPASLEHYGGVTDLGTWPLGTEVSVKALVEDVTGFPVMGSTVWFQPEDADLFNSSTGPVAVVTTGVVGDEDNVNTDVNGVAAGGWTLNTPGERQLTAYGVGYATPPVTGDDETDGLVARDNVSPVPFEIVFTATATVQLAFTTQPQDVRLGNGGDPLVADLTDVVVCAVDAAGNVVDVDGETVTLVAVNNNGTPADLGGTVTGDTVDGCVTFDDLTLNKTGAYRLVANDEFWSRKFNVRPEKKN